MFKTMMNSANIRRFSHFQVQFWPMCSFCFIHEKKVFGVSAHMQTNPGPEVIKLFPCSTQLSMKFQMLISKNIYHEIQLFLAQISLECYFSFSEMLKCQQLVAF